MNFIWPGEEGGGGGGGRVLLPGLTFNIKSNAINLAAVNWVNRTSVL